MVRPMSGAVRVLRNLAFYPMFYGGTGLILVLATLALVLPPSVLTAMVHGWNRWHRWCCASILGIKVVVEGTVPDHPMLAAIRHESFFEAIDLPVVLPHPMIFAKRALFRIPLWGRLGRRYGLIPVDREAGARALRAMLAAARDNEAGRPLAIFPEGTRAPHGQSLPLQAGFAALYKMSGLPVVPIAVDSGPLYHRWWKRAGTITYRIGAALPPGLPRAEIEGKVHAAINALNR